jgi:tricorn protease
MKRTLLALTLIWTAGVSRGDTDRPLLMQKPTINRTHVAFVYADQLWRVSREGGRAELLTVGPGRVADCVFSPDGGRIALTVVQAGNADVYVMPAEGGPSRRLTYHPGVDGVAGWTPDGKQVLFYSLRSSFSRFLRLFTIPVDGGLPTELPLPEATRGSFSPDGRRLACTPLPKAFNTWKRYRGGLASPIWIADLDDSHVEKIPRKDSNDFNPMWVGDTIYFLSDRNGPVTLFAYDATTGKNANGEKGEGRVRQVLENDGMDIKSAGAGPDAIVYERLGSLHLYDLNTGRSRKLNVRIEADLPALRSRFVKVAKHIQSAGLSPTGARAVFEARGDIFTVPSEKGDARDLTNTPGVAERDPAWSPDGKSIAYLSDESGEYELHVRDAQSAGRPSSEPIKKLTLGQAPSFYYAPRWSPDGKKIAYTDKRLNLWFIELATGKSTLVDTDTLDNEVRTLDPVWSPDSRWLAYTKHLESYFHAVFLYSLDSGKARQLTDGQSDCRFPVFDRSGKYLYYTASTDIGPTAAWNDMSGFNHPVTRGVHVVVLRDDLPSPLAPQSDEEKTAEGTKTKKDPEKETAADTRVDWDRIDQRILALPIAAHNYTGILQGKGGVIFLIEGPAVPSIERENAVQQDTLHRFDLGKRQLTKLADGVATVAVSGDGEKLLYRQGEHWRLVGSGQPPKPDEGTLKTDAMEMRLDPKGEWRQMYHEAWRIERDFLYDPHHHGYDLKAAEKKYAQYLDGVGSRDDLNYLFSDMLGELTLGHVYISGGDGPAETPVKGGLLGADYAVENGRYRFARVYEGENSTPGLRAPLTQPGVNVRAGEYLLAVNGHDLRPPESVYRAFEATAGKSVTIRVGPDARGQNARDVTVVPLESESALRNHAWIEANRRKVDRMTGGRVAYIYLPDTWVGGYTSFNRSFFSQVGKQAAIIDERFNGGGYLADYIIDFLRRPVMSYWTSREGRDITTPMAGIFGPKVMITNEYAGSGGDLMPWMFRRARVGPLVGKRTWGGAVGIYDNPPLIDGGSVTAPRQGFWAPEGKWDIENHGVAPDFDVDLDPRVVRAGHDPQIDKAVEVVLEALKKNPAPAPQHPPFPNYHPANSASAKGRSASAAGR